MKDYFVEIYKLEGGEVVKKMGPHGERQANRIADGASINLDHANYGVRVVDQEGNEV